jgi:predicted dehydrogenase
MKFLVIGLGSMGKRRIRNLQCLGIKNIAGFDTRTDRIEEAAEKYGVSTYSSLESAIEDFDPNIFIISTPPDCHLRYANLAVDFGIDCFIEASVVGAEEIRNLAKKSLEKGVIIAPSCTMQYYPGPKKIKQIINEGLIGSPLYIQYHSGQYLEDWHPWERIEDFYVSKRETGAAREIVPFELTWLNDIFGDCKPLSCCKKKLSSMNVDIDDIYLCLLEYDSGAILNLTVEVLSRPILTREMRVVGENGEVIFSADSNSIRYINTNLTKWVEINLEVGKIEEGYVNPENPYIEEMKDFLDAVNSRDINNFPNNLIKDACILELLTGLEKLS